MRKKDTGTEYKGPFPSLYKQWDRPDWLYDMCEDVMMNPHDDFGREITLDAEGGYCKHPQAYIKQAHNELLYDCKKIYTRYKKKLGLEL